LLKSVVWQGKETKQTSVSDSRAGEEERRGPTEDGDTVSDEGVDESVLDELEKEKKIEMSVSGEWRGGEEGKVSTNSNIFHVGRESGLWRRKERGQWKA